MDIDAFAQALDELAEELPACFYERLSGGVSVSERTKRDGTLYVLGEYRRGRDTGRSIMIYYGSFMAAFPGYDEAALRREMRRTLRHEFRHHMESLAGEDALEREDAAYRARYRNRHTGGE